MRLLAILFLSILLSSPVLAFQSFDLESKSLAALVKCEGGRVKEKRNVRIFSCSGGEGKTIKLYLSEKKGKEMVVKIVWKEYIQDIGYGVATDRLVVNKWHELLIAEYAQSNMDVKMAFWGGRDFSKALGPYRIEVSSQKNASVIQRRMIISMD